MPEDICHRDALLLGCLASRHLGLFLDPFHFTISYDLYMKFEWDEVKASANLKKHGVSFEEAKTVFDHPLALIFDEEHSVGSVEKLSSVTLGIIDYC